MKLNSSIKVVLIICFNFLAFSIIAQEKVKDSIVSKRSLESCTYRDSTNNKIDFTSYSKIAVCSIDMVCVYAHDGYGNSKKEKCYEQTVISNGKIIDYRFNEIIFLENEVIIELDSIIHSKMKNDNSHISCYNPRNAILFYDENGNIKDCLELCFECQGNRTTFSGIYQFDLCSEQYKELSKLLVKMGVKRGVTDK